MSQRILVLSDIHANLPALEAVLTDAGSVDTIWCLGDIVGYGPYPNECVDLIRALKPEVSVLGNHDAAATGLLSLSAFNTEARIAAQWTGSILSSDNQTFIKAQPLTMTIHTVTCVHGTMRNPLWEYMLDSYTALVNLSQLSTPVCLVGHTHIPGIFRLSSQAGDMHWYSADTSQSFSIPSDLKVSINPGSVGQPRDHDNRASYGILDIENDRLIWKFFRIEYDYMDVQSKIISYGLPRIHADRLSGGW